MKEPIRPGILMPDGSTYYPTGHEWLLFFALKGCQWAIDEIELLEIKKWNGDGI